MFHRSVGISCRPPPRNVEGRMRQRASMPFPVRSLKHSPTLKRTSGDEARLMPDQPRVPFPDPRLSGRGRDCLHCDVRHLALCAALDEKALQHLERIVSAVTLAPGQTLFDEGDSVKYVFNVLTGTLRLHKLLPDGQRQITGFGLRGDFLGLSAEGCHPYSAEAVSQVELCRFLMREMRDLFSHFTELERRLLAMREEELITAQDRMVTLGRRNPIEKISAFLLEFSHRQERWGQAPTPLTLAMTRGDIADYLGLTVETVSRTFTRLKSDGIIALPEATRVELIDRERLNDILLRH